jgi:YesN/AraC family two-component response regulator
MLDFLERVLRRRFAVTRCNSAERAIETVNFADFDVLVTDQKMPRVSGIEMLEQLRDGYPNLVKVLISGFTDVPDIQRAVERCGIHAYIVKPVDSRKLLEAIDEAYEVRDGKKSLVAE